MRCWLTDCLWFTWQCDTCRGDWARHMHSRGRGSHARCRPGRSPSPGWWILTVCEGHHGILVTFSLTWSPSPWASCPCRFPTPPPPRWPRENLKEHSEAENRNHNINHTSPWKQSFYLFRFEKLSVKYKYEQNNGENVPAAPELPNWELFWKL